MMKNLLLSLVATLLFIGFAGAQDLSLSWEGEPLGDTVLVVGDPADFEILFHAQITNNTDDAMNLKVFRKRLELLEGTVSLFCWGLCYAPQVDTSSLNINIAAGATSGTEDFSGHYQPNNVIGTSIVEYTFYDMDNPDTRISIVCKYKASPANVAEEAMRNGFVSEVYPNPATNLVNLDYRLTPQVDEARVQLYNLMGAQVKEIELQRSGNQLQMDVSDLKNGIYFYSVLVNGEVYRTKKLIIQ